MKTSDGPRLFLVGISVLALAIGVVASGGNIPGFGLFVLGAVGLVILGIGATVYLALTDGHRRVKRMARPHRNRKSTSRRRRRP